MPAAEVITRPLVLVADPDIETCVLIRRQLAWAGYGVLSTARADEAMELIEERRPDALVTEAKLAGGTGYGLVRELRAQPHNRLLPIVMISARAGKLDRDFAFTVGADEYMRKPFRCSALISRLAQLTPVCPPAPAVEGELGKRRTFAQPALAVR